MLSPAELESKKVTTKKRKYEKAEVDTYLELVFDNYKAVYDENIELQKKVKTLSDGIQYYRSIESTMQKALVLAEKTSKETKDAAILKAEAIEKDANIRAEHIVSEAEQKYDVIKDKCLQLMQQFNNYKTQLKQAATSQLELITSDSFNVVTPDIQTMDENVSEIIHSKENNESNVRETKTESTETVDSVRTSESDMSIEDLSETMVIPDVKEHLTSDHSDDKKTTENIDKTVDILTADTIDLSHSLDQIQNKLQEEVDDKNEDDTTNGEASDGVSLDAVDKFEFEDSAASGEENLEISNENSSENDLQLEDVDSTNQTISSETASDELHLDVEDTVVKVQPVKTLEAELIDATPTEPETLEPIDVSSKEAPTLDSLLQSMNISGKKKHKKNQEDDPFEFLGSVDDF